MVEALSGIGITVGDYMLYLTVTSDGAVCVVPIRLAPEDGEQNEYDRTKEIGLLQARGVWVRLYTDLRNKCYKVYPGASWTLQRADVAGTEAREDLPPRVPRQGPPDRQHRTPAFSEVGGA